MDVDDTASRHSGRPQGVKLHEMQPIGSGGDTGPLVPFRYCDGRAMIRLDGRPLMVHSAAPPSEDESA